MLLRGSLTLVKNREDLVFPRALTTSRTFERLLKPSIPARETSNVTALSLVQILALVANTALLTTTLGGLT